jgi:rhodanese-related sulfurtransferase
MMLWAMAAVTLFAGQFDKVRITPDLSYLYVYHKGKAVKVHRIQDTKHKLTGEYAKTYRPDRHIQPIQLNEGVTTIGEIEMIHFMKHKVNKRKGLILDVRTRERYANDSIPSAVNVPYSIVGKEAIREKLFKSLGLHKKEDATWNTERALELVIYCDGLWCDKSTKMIKTLLEHGYPSEKLFYYRGGFQMWKILGFTTVKNK